MEPDAVDVADLRSVVDKAREVTRERAVASKGNPVYASIEAQLLWISQVLDSGTRPSLDETNRLILGIIAAREFEGIAPSYASMLHDISYRFGRWTLE
jgi:Tsi6